MRVSGRSSLASYPRSLRRTRWPSRSEYDLTLQYDVTFTPAGSLDALNHSYCGHLKAAILKFLDTVVGYILYVQTPAHFGEDCLVRSRSERLY